MSKLSGTFNGQKCADLRLVHLNNYQQKYYQDRREWDLISKVGTYGPNDTTSVQITFTTGLIRKDTWKRTYKNGKMKWQRKEEYVSRKGQSS